MYPFTFPRKEYGDEQESQQGVRDTHAYTHTQWGPRIHALTDTITNVFALLCCHNQDIVNYHRFRLEAVSCFRCSHCSQMKG